MATSRDPMLDREPSAISLAAVVLVPIGLVVIFAGLCLGGWLVSVVHSLLYHPDQVPLVSKVLELLQKDDVVFQMVQENGKTKFEGAGIKYGILLALLFVAFLAVGSVIKGCISGGASMITAGLGRKTDDSGKK
jgi:hypothetical protein